MRKKSKISFLILFMLLSMLFCYSCRFEESSKEFHVKTLGDISENEFFSAEGLDFATINGVVIEPEIREVQYNQYRIYLSAHSLTDTEQVSISKVVLKDIQNKYYENLEEHIITYEKQGDTFKGTYNVGEFVLSENASAEIKDLQMIVEVQVGSGGTAEVKEILYDIEVLRYMSTRMSL